MGHLEPDSGDDRGTDATECGERASEQRDGCQWVVVDCKTRDNFADDTRFFSVFSNGRYYQWSIYHWFESRNNGAAWSTSLLI